jgi:hypothetical protein
MAQDESEKENIGNKDEGKCYHYRSLVWVVNRQVVKLRSHHYCEESGNTNPKPNAESARICDIDIWGSFRSMLFA